MHADTLDAASFERQQISQRDTFLPHGLAAEAIAALQEQLSRQPRIGKAWLAQKKVVHHPEHPFYVLVCRVRWRWFDSSNDAALQKILDEILNTVRVNGGNEYFLLLERSCFVRGVSRRVRKAAGRRVYPGATQQQRSAVCIAKNPQAQDLAALKSEALSP